MADFKKLLTVTMNAASNTSRSSAFILPTEFSEFAMRIPVTSTWCVTATANVRIMSSDSDGGTYHEVGYGSRPDAQQLTSTSSGWVISETPVSAGVSGGVVMVEGLSFVQYGQLRFTNTATAAANFIIYGRVRT